jgi:hypothetical protein
MTDENIPPITPTESFDATFWEYNYPVGLYTDDDDGKNYYTIFMPRKDAVYNSIGDEDIPKEELETFCNNAITKFKIAIKLFEAFRDGKIDHIYYWDRDKIPEKKKGVT